MSAPMQSLTRRHRTADEDAALWKRFRGTVGEPVRAPAAPWLKLVSATPPEVDWTAVKPVLPPNAMRGDALRRGIWRFGLERYELGPGDQPWDVEDASLHYFDRIHRFNWMVHLAAQGEEGQDKAVWLVDAWIERFGRFDGFAWRPGPTADRVWNWLQCAPLLFGDTDSAIGKLRVQALRRQIAHLESMVDASTDVVSRFRTFCLLVLRHVLHKDADRTAQALDRLEAECSAQILPDGGHVSRSPERLLHALIDLIVVRDTLRANDEATPEFLDKWLPRMGAMLNFFRSEDGGLHPFNDGGEAEPDWVDAALNALDATPRRFSFSPKSGFQKLERGETSILLDVGRAPDQPFGDMAHAGALGFELADGPARIVTSCAYSSAVNVDWQAAVRRTGAHSTLVLGGRDNTAFAVNEATGLLSPVGPDGISAKRLEEADEVWLDAQHSGYKESFGLLHRRRLFLAGDGSRLTGEDSLVRPVSRDINEDERPIGFEIRFHLHPTVTALMGRGAITLECENGARWRFKTSHAGARLERTIYLGRGSVENPEQIVISGRADPNGDGSEPPNCVRWAFVRERGSV